MELTYWPEIFPRTMFTFTCMRVKELTLARMPSRMPLSPRYAPQSQAVTATRVGFTAPRPMAPSPMKAMGRR